MGPVKRLKTLVSRNIQHAEERQKETINTDQHSYRYWDGYISALKSIVDLLPEDED
jgi:hypothetical protein